MLLLGWSVGFLAVVCCATEETGPSNGQGQAAASNDACSSNPCQYGGKCTNSPESSSFKCECPYPTNGKDCSNAVGACYNCARNGKQVLFLLNDKPMNFNDSVEECERQNLTMFMPKTKEDFLFAQKHMQKLDSYFGPASGHYAYWVGARRATNADPFRWLDGTEIGDYQPWANGKADPGNRNCLEMASAQFNWSNDRCEKATSGFWGNSPACTAEYVFFE